MRFWGFCAERRAKIHNVLPRDLFQFNGYNPVTVIFRDQEGISNISQFDWYDWCYYHEQSAT